VEQFSGLVDGVIIRLFAKPFYSGGNRFQVKIGGVAFSNPCYAPHPYGVCKIRTTPISGIHAFEGRRDSIMGGIEVVTGNCYVIRIDCWRGSASFPKFYQ